MRPELHSGELNVRPEGTDTDSTRTAELPVAFVVLPELVTVPLGPEGETLQVAVSDTEGFLGWDGRPFGRDGLVTASKGDKYRLSSGPGGITASFESGEQVLDLPNGGSVTLQQRAEGDWRIGEDRVQSGHRHIEGGHEHVFELSGGRWRVAQYAVSLAEPAMDRVPAIETSVSPTGIAVDASGNVFIAEGDRYVVRVLDQAGLISTVVRNRDQYDKPTKLALDGAGNLYVAFRRTVVKYDAIGLQTGAESWTRVAGTGTFAYGHSGDGGPATEAKFRYISALTIDTAGNLYIADQDGSGWESVVRRVDTNGIISTVAGNRGYGGKFGRGDGGPATDAALGPVSALSVDATGNLYIGGGNRVRKVDTGGIITTFVGGGDSGVDRIGVPATQIRLDEVSALAVDAAGHFYVADYGRKQLMKIDTGGTITELRAASVLELATDAVGNLYVAKEANVLKIDPTGARTRIAGNRKWDERVFQDSRGARYATVAGGVVRTNPSGTSTSTFPSPYISDLAGAPVVDRVGNIYVVSEGRLLKINASGTYILATFPRHVLGGVALDAHDNFFVCGGTTSEHYPLRARLWTVYPVDGSYKVDAVLEQNLGSNYGGCSVDGAGRVSFRSFSGTSIFDHVTMEPLPGPMLTVVKLPGGGSIRLTKSDSGVWELGGESVHTGYLFVRGSTEYALLQLGEHWRVSRLRVPLGSSGENAEIEVLSDGTLVLEPSRIPLANGSQFTASNFDTYTLQVGSDDISATLVPQSQRVDLRGGGALRLSQSPSGDWRFGGTTIESGHKMSRNGWLHRIVRSQGRWQAITLGPAYSIRTVVGTTAVKEGVPATEASLSRPGGVAVDSIGNVFVADTRNHRIRRINAAGVINTVAGSGEAGYSGDGGLAIEARLFYPRAVAVDAAGNIYVADSANHRVRKVNRFGVITGIGGSYQRQWSYPTGVAVDIADSVYVAESDSVEVRRVDTAGLVSTVFDGGEVSYWGWGSQRNVIGVAVDDSANTYVVGGTGLKKVSPAGVTTTLGAGALFPDGVAVGAAGDIFVAHTWNGLVQEIDSEGTITTVAGGGTTSRGEGKPATSVKLLAPTGVAVDSAGSIYIAETWGNRVSKVDVAGTIKTLAGTGDPIGGWTGGPVGQARLFSPSSIAVNAARVASFTDERHVYKLDSSGVVNLVATVNIDPKGVAVDAAGNVYVADVGGRVSKMAPSGSTSVWEGDSSILGLALDLVGNLYVATGNLVRKIDVAGNVTTVAGGGVGGDASVAKDSQLFNPTALAVDSTGNVIYIVDKYDRRLSKVAAGRISTLFRVPRGEKIMAVGTDTSGSAYIAVGTEGSTANLYEPGGFIPSGAGNEIRKIGADGSVSVIAGAGKQGFNGDGDRATEADLSVAGLAVDGSGSVWFTDPVNRRIRMLQPKR